MFTVQRKHPLSLAISMSLFAAVATSAMASPPVDAQGGYPLAQAATPQEPPAEPPKARWDQSLEKYLIRYHQKEAREKFTADGESVETLGDSSVAYRLPQNDVAFIKSTFTQHGN